MIGIFGIRSREKGNASETVRGIIEIATQAETDAGTDDARAVTPLKLDTTPEKPAQATKAALEAETDENTYIAPDFIRHSPGVAKFWVRFNGTSGGPITPDIDFNVVDVTDSGPGLYIINIQADFSTANFAAFAIAQDVSANGAICQIDSNPAAGTFSIEITNRAGAAIDPNIVCAGGFGDQ